MIKSKNKWTLHCYKTYKNFPSVTYFWSENGIVKFQRDICPVGFLPVVMESIVGNPLKLYAGIKKVNTKMSQEQLSRGWLCR